MKVFAVYCPERNAYIGTRFYVSDKPRFYFAKGAATNKVNKMLRYFNEVCVVHEFDVVLKTE